MPQLAPPKARELTKAERDKLVKKCFGLEADIKKLVLAEHAVWWTLAEKLYEFNKERGWELLGYEHLGEFLAQPDLGMKKSMYYEAVHCWGDLHEVRELPKETLEEIPPSKAIEIRPAIMAGAVKPEQAIQDAKTLSWRDCRTKYRASERTLDPDDEKSRLDAEKEPERVQCEACGSWVEKTVLEGRAREVVSERSESQVLDRGELCGISLGAGNAICTLAKGHDGSHTNGG